MDPPPGLEAVLAIPPTTVPTSEARAAMPDEVPLEEAVDNVAHASVLVLGLAQDDFSLIGRGLRDRLHQQRRRHLYPRSMELLERAEELGAVGATISGAGPAVLFWCHWQQTGNLMEALRAAADDCVVRRVQFAMGEWLSSTGRSTTIGRSRRASWIRERLSRTRRCARWRRRPGFAAGSAAS